MDEIKFRCPECTQKIAVAATAKGVKIDCPTCHSRLVIPPSGDAPVEVLIKRKLAVVGGDSDAVYEELKKAQSASEKAAAENQRLSAELDQLRNESAKAREHAKADLMALQLTCDSLSEDAAAAKQLRQKLSEANDGKAREESQRLSAELERLRAEHAKSNEQAKSALTALQATFDALKADAETWKQQGRSLSDADADKAAAETQRLTAELERLRAENEKTAGQAKSELAALHATCHALKAEAAAAQQQYQKLPDPKGRKATEENQRLRAALDRMRLEQGTAAEQAKADLAALQATCDSLKAEAAASKQHAQNLSETRDEKATGENQRLNAELERLRAEHEKAAEQAKTEIVALQFACDSLRADAAAPKRQEPDLSNVADEKSAAEIQRLNTALENLRAEHQKAAGHAEADLVALQLTCDSLHAEAAALKPLRQNLSETHEELIDARRQVAAAAKEFVAVQTERNEMAAQLSAFNSMREDLAKAKEDLEHARQDAADAIRMHQTQADHAGRAEATLREEFGALQTAHADAHAKIAEHANQIASLHDERKQLAAEIDALTPLGDQLRQAQEDLAHAREEASAAAQKHREESEFSRQDESALKVTLDELQKKLADQTSENATLRQRHSELETSLDQLNPIRDELAEKDAQMDGLREELARAIRQRDDAIHSTEAVADSARMEASAALQAKLDAAEQRIAGLGHGFTGLKNEHDELKSRTTAAGQAAQSELSAAREEAQHIRSQLPELKQSLASAHAERDQALALAAERQTNIDELTKFMETAKIELAQLREELTISAKERSRTEAGSEKTSKEAGMLQERVAELTSETEQRNEALAALRKSLDSALTDAAAKEDRIHDLTAKAQALTDLMDEQERALQNIAKDARERGAKELEAKERIEKAERMATEAAERAKPIEEEHRRLSEELARKSAELEKVRVELSRAGTQPPHPGAPADHGAAAGGREKALEAERDALRAELEGVKTALERAKQHVSVLQARRDLLRDEIAKLRARLGIGGQVTAAGGNPLEN